MALDPTIGIPLINGRAYEFSQITVDMLGGLVIDVTAINYQENQEKTNNYGTGRRPVSRGHGAIEASASIDISMNSIEAIRAAAPGNSLLCIPAFDIKVTYLNSGKVVTDVLKNCEFLNDERGSSQGDTDISASYELIISHVEWDF